MSQSPAPKDFFISYNKNDKDWAEWIAFQLEEAGYTLIIQAWDFRPGGNFVLDMQQATSECQRTIAVLSEDYVKSVFTAPEWAGAFVNDPTGVNSRLLPIKVKDCKPTGLLRAIVSIGLVGKSQEEAKQILLDGVKVGRVKPTSVAFPGATKQPATRVVPDAPRFPGTLPEIWNVPHSRNLNFTGRKDLLEELEKTPTAAITQAIAGLGGVGKTQLAVEFAYRHMADFELVWWIRAGEELTHKADLVGLATALSLEEASAKDQQVAINAALRWLERKGVRWLLIFDNVNFPKELDGYLPKAGDGKIIVTSRYAGDWLGVAYPLRVKVWRTEEAVQFLKDRTGQSETEVAELLAENLGYLPLALEQAAAYINETQISLSKYRELYAKYSLKVLEEAKTSQNYHQDKTLGRENDTVATTWFMALENLPQEAKQFMNVCSFLAPEEIPFSLFTENTEELPENLAKLVKDQLRLNRLKAELKAYSLIEIEKEAFTVHRLVQTVGRERLSEDDRKEWVAMAARLVSAALPTNVRTDLNTWETLK